MRFHSDRSSGAMRAIIAGAAIIGTLLLSGCVVTENLALQSTTGGTSTTDLVVLQFFSEVLEDMSAFAPASDETITDAAVRDFTNNLASANNTSDVTYEIIPMETDSAYTIDFGFKNLQQLFTDLSGGNSQSILTVKQAANRTTLDFFLDINNYPQLTKIIPFLADPNFEVWGPLYNTGETADNYLEMMSFILSEDGPPAIENSMITLRFTTPSKILSNTNGKVVNATTFEYSFPLIDFLLLHKPLKFSVSW